MNFVRRFTPGLLVLALSAGVGAGAAGQTVWRCGPDGRGYQQQPCDGGRSVDVADPRSAADVAEARALQSRERRLVNTLVAERRTRDREVKALGSQLLGIEPAPGAEVSPRPSDWQPVPATRRAPVRRSPSAAGTSRGAAPGSRPVTG